MIPSCAEILHDIAAELSSGEIRLQMLEFERAESGETVTTIIVSTHKTGENTA